MVATPIGHLDDISQRAVQVLAAVPVVAAEDTRRTRVLLAHIGAAPRQLLALHDHNEAARSKMVLALLTQGQDVALVSDAGTPLISDPGFELVRLAAAQGIRVVPIPGPSALTTLLSVSPLPVERFFFEGFLPSKAGARQRRLASLLRLGVTLVLFESPRRLPDLLADVAALAGPDAQMVIGKELTKLHERILSGSVSALLARLQAEPALQKGEFVCLLAPSAGAAAAATSGAADQDQLLQLLLAELAPAKAAKLAARITGASKAELYQRALQLGGTDAGAADTEASEAE